jgi:hypothetical protein
MMENVENINLHPYNIDKKYLSPRIKNQSVAIS